MALRAVQRSPNKDLAGKAQSEDGDTGYRRSEEGTQNGESGRRGQKGRGSARR